MFFSNRKKIKELENKLDYLEEYVNNLETTIEFIIKELDNLRNCVDTIHYKELDKLRSCVDAVHDEYVQIKGLIYTKQV